MCWRRGCPPTAPPEWTPCARCAASRRGRGSDASGPRASAAGELTVLRDLGHEFRQAAASLRRSPLFAIVTVVTLAFGVGFSSGTFGIVHHLLLTPVSFRGLDRLVMVFDRVPSKNVDRGRATTADYLAWERAAQGIARLGAWSGNEVDLGDAQASERLDASAITPSFLGLLAVRPALGRPFDPRDATPGAPGVTLLSDALWRRRFGADPHVIGRTVRLDEKPVEVIGVLPKGFAFPFATDVWLPLEFRPGAESERRERVLTVVGRLEPGASIASLREPLEALALRNAAEFPDTHAGHHMSVLPMARGVLDPISPSFELVSCVAQVFMLLVTCANLAGLMLARGAARRREFAVRAALGASGRRLARHALVESLMLSAIGGGAGVWVAWATVRWVQGSIPPDITRYIPGWSDIGLDGVVLAYTLGLSVLTGLVFGLAPALQASRVAPAESMREGGAGALGTLRARGRRALVIAEVAASFALLVGSLLMIQGFRRLASPEQGFEPRHVLALSVDLSHSRYATDATRATYTRRAVERLATLPGVRSAAATDLLPWAGSTREHAVDLEGSARLAGEEMRGSLRRASPDYFGTLRIPVGRGRAFTAADDSAAASVAVVSEAFARRAWPRRDPIGRRLRFGQIAERTEWRTVVGVVADVRRNWFDRDMAPTVYVPMAQWPPAGFQLAVRAEGDPAPLAESVRRALAALDPLQPAYRVQPLERALQDQISGVRIGATIMGLLGLFALLLTAPRREDVLALVMREGSRLALAGVALGAPVAITLALVMAATLFGVVRPQWWELAGVALTLAAISALASGVPAWRASRLDPVDALRRD
ncbi:MAG: ABC transporter permease [Deltaproteobacteria bacterium]|nr:MAG: ABC transporter permease [Deltaproteobacteria bacterium]